MIALALIYITFMCHACKLVLFIERLVLMPIFTHKKILPGEEYFKSNPLVIEKMKLKGEIQEFMQNLFYETSIIETVFGTSNYWW